MTLAPQAAPQAIETAAIRESPFGLFFLGGWQLSGRPGVARGYPPGPPREQHPRNPQTGNIIFILFVVVDIFLKMF